MALDANGYFHHIKSYFNLAHYAVPIPNAGELVLKEKIDVGGKKKEFIVRLNYIGEVFAIKLDKEVRRGHHEPLFHFLDNQGKPWSKRCDFVIFQLDKKQIKAYCLEFKNTSVDSESVVAQLKASENWCRALNSIINIYTGHKRKIKLTKYLVTDCTPERAATYLDAANEYLARDPSIRHYLYSEIDRMSLSDLEHAIVETVG
ncbi:hypothetical protein [Photobacterium lipolyticum]|uniref:Uncharacterized protein n=1 Tax=Photobacterium lipolyticum TaxID=266810 RepID=A0A2T3MTG3_9GAMM|nr:hypothetical protein [Photobacterium lipolyticum]PSW02564.1 hypothetical protein C9I89_18770 [Photobacterium lipolyticum]